MQEKKLTPDQIAAMVEIQNVMREVGDRLQIIDKLADQHNLTDHLCVYYSGMARDWKEGGELAEKFFMAGNVYGCPENLIQTMAQTAAKGEDPFMLTVYRQAFELGLQLIIDKGGLSRIIV